MGTKCKKMIQGIAVALMLFAYIMVCGANSQPIGDDDFVVDVDNDTWIYSMCPTGCVEFAGYKLGESYHGLTNGAKIVCDDVVKCYTPTVSLDPPCHGIKSLNLCLSPLNHILVSMSASRVMDFKDRQELMGVGLSILDDLLKQSGKPHPKFMFTAPHRPYWPSRKAIVNLWEGPLPKLYTANESMWPTSKIIFATSKTYVGDCIVHLKMGVANYDEYDLSFSASSKSAAAKSEKEFRTAFRAKHDGKTYEEWSKMRTLGSDIQTFAEGLAGDAELQAMWTIGTNVVARIAQEEDVAEFRKHIGILQEAILGIRFREGPMADSYYDWCWSIDIFDHMGNQCVKAMWKRTQELPWICDFRLKQMAILRREMERIADAKPKPAPPNFEGVHPTLDMVQSTLKTSLRRAYEDMLWDHPFKKYYKRLTPEEKRSWEKRIEEASGMPLEFLKL